MRVPTWLLALVTAAAAGAPAAGAPAGRGRRLSETVASDGSVSAVRWLPPLENEYDAPPDKESRIDDGTIMPVFPVQGVLFMPYNNPNLTMKEPRYRRMYEEVIFTGAKRFAAVRFFLAITLHDPPAAMRAARSVPWASTSAPGPTPCRLRSPTVLSSGWCLTTDPATATSPSRS